MSDSVPDAASHAAAAHQRAAPADPPTSRGPRRSGVRDLTQGPIASTLLVFSLPILGGNVLQDAFGVVALVAMMPLISIQMMGVLYGRRKPAAQPEPEYGDDDIVELWG